MRMKMRVKGATTIATRPVHLTRLCDFFLLSAIIIAGRRSHTQRGFSAKGGSRWNWSWNWSCSWNAVRELRRRWRSCYGFGKLCSQQSPRDPFWIGMLSTRMKEMQHFRKGSLRREAFKTLDVFFELFQTFVQKGHREHHRHKLLFTALDRLHCYLFVQFFLENRKKSAFHEF